MGHVDFVAPAFVGDVGMGQAKVVFTSKRSVLVLVHVWSENPRSGEVRLCNRAFAWYVPLKLTGDAIFEVPQLKVDPTDSLATCLWEYAHSSYTKRRVNGNPSRGSYLAPNHPLVSKIPLDGEEKTNDDGHDFIFPLLPMKCPPGNEAAPDYRTVEETEANLAALVLPSDMLTGDFAAGGMIMKMIDNCAGIVAFKHCRSNVVTASLDALDFMRPIKSGNLVTLRGKATYASPKSLEILVTVEVEDLMAGTRQPANQAILTFVKLDAAGKVQPMPGLIINTRKQHERMRIGHERYEIRKRIRSAQPIARP
ncbi:hypothetical protein SARC_04475 [Sphaeroforma arctica JP610]|uniref:HotDog ACOT-type domain-containing protein n=1 Tax=Sphaeroforma arctica JP610 TaxID=667725 RepID=A0A0L0G327_9EUKA|nr:hypothetical protein SARC_04475 [Sphaeroforma arctica JP610]KNC83259.1 hypothetical protein SARC_04475 [Sphaeroforma arctica JP610]|eukprot:XP_014157161.1 hypothetical protein SARC_04475 [Sphaeroforma arctica JP610]